MIKNFKTFAVKLNCVLLVMLCVLITLSSCGGSSNSSGAAENSSSLKSDNGNKQNKQKAEEDSDDDEYNDDDEEEDDDDDDDYSDNGDGAGYNGNSTNGPDITRDDTYDNSGESILNNDNGGSGSNGGEEFNQTWPEKDAQGMLGGSLNFQSQNHRGDNCIKITGTFHAKQTFSYQTEVMIADANKKIASGNGVAGYADWYGSGVLTAQGGMEVTVNHFVAYSDLSNLQRGVTYYMTMYMVDPDTHERLASTNMLSFKLN